MIWFSSDFHYGHKNICRGVSEWTGRLENTRDFKTLEEMNDAIVDGINSVVQQNDILYFLGDWSFGGVDNVWNLRKRIPCKTIHFVLGNHEQQIKKNPEIALPATDRIILDALDIPYEADARLNYVHLQDLFTSVNYYREIEIDKQIFVLSHYPMEEWFEMDRKGGIMLHGHCHHTIDNCTDNTVYKRMDIGIDWKEFRPYSVEEITGRMYKRKLKKHINEVNNK
jgi:calcineurin-like phosphoesterase family protein